MTDQTDHDTGAEPCLGTMDPRETIHGLFESQVRRTPGATAVTFQNRSLTYSELDREANRVARALRHSYLELVGSPLCADEPVALLLERGLRMVVGILAILKAGGAYVPLDPSQPPLRSQFILRHTGCRVALTESSLRTKLASAEACTPELHSIQLDQPQNWVVTGRASERRVQPGDLAYVMYTSGTTGTPKGIMIEHRSVVNLVHSRELDFAITHKSVVLQLAPITFDASVCELFSTLCRGARLVIADKEAKRDPRALVALLTQERVSVATVLPSLLTQMALDGVPALPYLQTLVVAGEPCTREVVEKWAAGRQLINAYGPTETTVCATVHAYRPGDRPNTLGRPIRNTQVHVLDSELRPTPVGVTGELYISGAGLARGYFRAPDLTRERFVFHPVTGGTEPTRLYKTGDLARWTEHGNLEYVGRNDFQVKIRGHRIELGEVESALSTAPGVQQVCVVARPRAGATEDGAAAKSELCLVAYYVSSLELQAEVLISHLSRALPQYMFPSCFMRVPQFSVTPHGKIDRGLLPPPRFGASSDSAVEPRCALERKLVRIWLRVLEAHHVGVEDDFFLVGGNSLLAITLASQISVAVGIELRVANVYEHRTVAAQAALIRTLSDRSAQFTPIAAFQTNGEKPALFFIHPSMGGAEIYRRMANWLDRDQPFYGVESYNCNHVNAPETCLQTLAKRYVGYIRAVQARGPYLIGGYSAGGNIAYEVAHQLLDEGEMVKRLYLIDSVLPVENPRDEGVTLDDARDFLDYFKLTDAADKTLVDLARAEMSLVFGYRPRAMLDAKVVLIKATHLVSPLDTLGERHIVNHLFQMSRPYSGWDQHAREVDRYEVRANHETIMTAEYLERVTRIIQGDINSHKVREMLDAWS